MKAKFLAAAATTALTLGLAAAPASAGGPPKGAGDGGQPVGIACMQHGHALLRSLGAPSQISSSVVGLPLNTVLELHRTNPAAAADVLVSLGLPAGPCDIS